MYTMLIIAIIGGTFSQDIRLHNIPFNNKEACVRAAKEAKASSSSQIGYICINQDTGETVAFK